MRDFLKSAAFLIGLTVLWFVIVCIIAVADSFCDSLFGELLSSIVESIAATIIMFGYLYIVLRFFY
jgi:hypothetical protein